ncbi:AAA family ATPase [Kribbella sp. NPDC051770]|uniref:ATP-dependent nuclease n=1 Tax=Kribbella sp. NPDC051770 TaxID=3155413 RepID=UPI00342BBE68
MERLWDSKELELKISSLFKRAFGFEVCVNRYSPQAGNGLLIGTPNRPAEPLPPRKEFLLELAGLPSLLSQGDGIRSFASILMATIVTGPPVVFIDEPEAFLHPPQAKLLGRYLVEETADGTQIIVATHSTDLIHGILNGATNREIKIIRLSPDHSLSVLPNTEIEHLWRDGLLRYSRMLDGLVHQGTVVCEADADCRFYAAAMDARISADHDVHFTHVGGKARMPEASLKLRKLNLRPAVIVDIDILNDDTLVKRLIEASGGDYSDIKDDLAIIQKEVEKKASIPTARAFKEAARPIMGRADASRIDDAEASAIIDSLKRDSGWKAVKASGLRAFKGDPLAAIGRVLQHLKHHGIFVVPVGEIEGWEPSVSGHGPSFVAKVLESGLHRTPSAHAPKAELDGFIADLTTYLGLSSPDPKV